MTHDTTPPAAIELQGISKTYIRNSVRVETLTNIDCAIGKGELVAVVGASGVGKTTLLHLMGALDRPTTGAVLHFGQDISALSDEELSRFRNKTLGFVFQFHHLLPEFTALENVIMPCLIAAMDKTEAVNMANEILSEMGLTSHRDHRIEELSGGEQQRVALARAMVKQPAILLADEPTGNLDEHTGERVAELIFEMNRRHGTTTVIVTHNLALAARMDRIIGLVEGKAMELSHEELKSWAVDRQMTAH
jgi:lipoprotein-releasing system ATP-binding protein